MNFFRLVSILCAVSLAAGCSSAAPSPVDTTQVLPDMGSEYAARRAMTARVVDAVIKEDTEALSAMAREFRASRGRSESGLWAIGLFHGDVQFQMTRDITRGKGCMSSRGKLVRKWLKDDPDEPAAIITAAHYQLRQAWCERGGGYFNSVPPEQWDKFQAGAQGAYALLDAHRETASVDPEYYTVTTNAYRAIGASDAQLEALLDEATAREPYYLRTYFEAATSYLPQWGGSYHALDDFARYAAERTATSDGMGFYYRVYWSLEDCGCAAPWNSGVWADMKQAARDVYERYPSQHNLNHALDVSCRVGDFDEALFYMWEKHPEATGEDDFVILMANCRALADEELAKANVAA